MQQGLTSQKARENLEKYGENKLEEKKKKSIFARFFAQLADAMVIILLVAAAVSLAIAIMGHDKKEFLEPLVILGIVILNAVMGVVQEGKAEKALASLADMSAPNAKVIRDGTKQSIPARLVVPEDIVELEAGDMICCDGVLLSSASLKCSEAPLTGESVPAEKDHAKIPPPGAPLAEQTNRVFSGCYVSYGRGTFRAEATGMNTEIGKIAKMLADEEQGQTPLQQKLSRLGKILGFVAIGICAVIFFIGLWLKMNPAEIFMTAVSLAVAAIPEGLPAIVTIVLAMGVSKMVKKNAITRKLSAVETLGGASVICSDKTGTLTQNKMTLVSAFTENGVLEDMSAAGKQAEAKKLLTYAALCTDAALAQKKGPDSTEDKTPSFTGDPTETAIVACAYENGIFKNELEAKSPRVSEIPFDSDRKRMTVIVKQEDGFLAITKGAVDSLAPLCVFGPVDAALAAASQMAQKAQRVLAVAFRKFDALPPSVTPETVEKDLTLLGLVSMIDPPRPEAFEAVKLCKTAGIRPVMITGDHIDTASAIASELGILNLGQAAITGAQLEQMDDAEFREKVENISVYARVSPSDKIKIVKAWQEKGQIVAMTGDGVNDAPALKAADIGCAMGITGTDVAKGAADIILTDDNFATIVDAAREGRGIYANMKKTISFLLGTNIGEVLTVFISMLLFGQPPLLAMQLLWINLVTDSLPALALGTEPVEPGIMKKPPRPKEEELFTGGAGLQIFLQGALFALITLIGYRLGIASLQSAAAGQTMAFLVLAQSQLFHAFNARSGKSLFKIGVFTNSRLNWAFLGSEALICLIAFVPPLAYVFSLVRLTPALYLWALALAVSPVAVLEIAKACRLVKE